MALNVTQLLRRRGFEIPLHKKIQTSYDVVSGGYPSNGIDTFIFTGVYVNFEATEVDGATVLVTDKKLLIDANSIGAIPEVGDVVSGTVNNGRVENGYKIMSVRSFSPNGVTIAYSCQVR